MDGKIVYTPLTMADSREFYELAGDERVAATMRFDCPRSLKESDRILEDYLAEGNRTFALRSGEGEPLWGVFAFKKAMEPGTADLSQMQCHDHWGKGLGNQVIEDMVALARKEKWYRALEGYILETNAASRKMAEHCGFREKARHRFPGMTEDLVVYRLELKEEEGCRS